MGPIGIRLEGCSDVIIDKVTGIGLDEVISAKDTKNLSATNIIAINNIKDLDNMINEFIMLIKDTPFFNESYKEQAEGIRNEIKKQTKDKKKLELFKTSLKNIYQYIDKGTKLATTILNLYTSIEKIYQI